MYRNMFLCLPKGWTFPKTRQLYELYVILYNTITAEQNNIVSTFPYLYYGYRYVLIIRIFLIWSEYLM